ncbi:MAG: hypothetical protein LOX97_02715 [Sphingomonas sp.]|nr:hypothetical protein [Sphingomonas sp.]
MFVRTLIEANQDDRKISRDEWLAALDARATGKGLGSAIARLLDEPAASSEPWARLLKLADVPHDLDADGSIALR